MKTDGHRIENLMEYVQGIMNREDGKELYFKYREDIEQVTPQEVFEIFYRLFKKGAEAKEILVFLDKVINVFYKSLIGYSWRKPEENSFMGILMQENQGLVKKLENIKEILREKDFRARKRELLPGIRELMEFNQHYLKKENILFPYMEKKLERFDGLAIMWALHDEARSILKKTIEGLEADSYTEAELNAQLGSLFFAMHGLVKKEELILFPAASEVIDENDWKEMQRQSLEYGFPFIKKTVQIAEEKNEAEKMNEFIADHKDGCMLTTETGDLSLEQILMIFNTMPVDMTFVDENDRVRFYTRPKDRIFPRSPAVIGRDVAKCHPPESVHKVHEIIEAFKAGRKDSAIFWINIKGKKILIQYFALRDPEGNYRGILEVSQDISEIAKLEGEKRLLHWE
ncbi:MAG TPA: PAS domain-containing protein [Clostridia bacterium]|nr:PAS domain-containing protein [Clostridia bacterium]